MHEVRVPIHGPLEAATFVERPNRFIVRCRMEDGAVVAAHLADPGRLSDLLAPGRRLWLRRSDNPARRTAWSAVLAERPDGKGLVSVDSTLPNRLIAHALREQALPELREWAPLRAEWRHGASRFDFVLAADDGRRLALEVKSVTLVEGDVAYFPDAVTARGARHVRELAEIVRQDGWEGAVLFVVQRDDAAEVRPDARVDPGFAEALALAADAGVRLPARRGRGTLGHVALGASLPPSGPAPADTDLGSGTLCGRET